MPSVPIDVNGLPYWTAAKRLVEAFAKQTGNAAFCVCTYGPHTGAGTYIAEICEPHQVGETLFTASAPSKQLAWKRLLRKILDSGVTLEELYVLVDVGGSGQTHCCIV